MRSLKHKKVLVFGGSGFLGSHLLKRLPNALNTGVDITNQSVVVNLIKQGWNIIINLAGISGTTESHHDISFEVNVIGSLNILEACRQAKIKPLILFSNSRQEYGRPQHLPVDELHPTNPTNLYGVHKLAVTHLAQLYYQTYNLPTIVFRTSNVYGPSPDSQKHDYNIINQWLKGRFITIFGAGRQKRDYLFIDDWVSAVIAALTTPKAHGQIFNIGYGQGSSLSSMARTIAKFTGAKIISKPWPQDWQSVETGNYVSNISKAKRILRWQPQTEFIAGVKKIHETTT